MTGDRKIPELIERLEKATGPDRQIDTAIHDALGFWRPTPGDDGYAQFPVPAYTASIDAALTLVPPPKDGWWSLEQTRSPDSVMRSFGTSPDIYLAKVGHWKGDEHFGRSDTDPAIALCIAALKARSNSTGAP